MQLDAAIRELVREVVREEIRTALREIPSVGGGSLVAGPGQPASGEGDSMWNVSRAAVFLGVSKSWLYHRAAAGTIPCTRVGHNLRFDPEALRAWVRGERRGGRVVPLK